MSLECEMSQVQHHPKFLINVLYTTSRMWHPKGNYNGDASFRYSYHYTQHCKTCKSWKARMKNKCVELNPTVSMQMVGIIIKLIIKRHHEIIHISETYYSLYFHGALPIFSSSWETIMIGIWQNDCVVVVNWKERKAHRKWKEET